MFTEEFSFWASLTSCKFRSWCKVFLIVVQKLFNSLVEIAIYVSRETFWRGKTFFLTQSFFFVWGFWPRFFWTFRQNNFVSFVENCIRLIQRKGLIKILSFKNLELLYQFRISNEKSPDFLLENFCTVVETVFSCPGYIWGKKFVEHCADFFVFAFWSINLHLCRNFFGCVVKTALFVPAEQTERYIVFENIYQALTIFGLQCRSYRILGGNFLQFRQFCILCVQRNFLDYKIFIRTKFSKSFSDIEQKLFGLLARSFWAQFSELRLRVHSNVFNKNIFFLKKI